MTFSIFTHPVSAFAAGLIVAAAGVAIFLKLNTAPNKSAGDVANYRKVMEKGAASGLLPGSPGELAAIERFTLFLANIGDRKYVRDNAAKVYSSDAYLDDTLSVHYGEAQIESYFIKTSETMTSYQVTIDDTARSGEDHYIRWTMVVSAPALSGGKPVHSVGVSQVRFNREGKVTFHQDFWDSGKNFHGHLPGVGGAVGYVRKRLQAN